MKKIILMRHAKSSWSNPGHSDKERPLNNRGQRAAALMGGWLAKSGLHPEHAIVSSSRRTQETWQAMAPLIEPLTCGPAVEDALYLAGPETMLDLLRATPDAASSVLMIAHQPGTGALTQLLSGDDICARCSRAFSHFPTAAVAVLEADIRDWPDLDFGAAAFRGFTCPKDLA